MGARCRPSEIRIPNDPAFAAAAAAYVAEVARLVGFLEPELGAVDQAMRTAITTLVRYSFEPGESEELIVSCESVAEGLKVTIQDKGLPFGSAEVSRDGLVCAPDRGSEFCRQILGLKEAFEEVRLHNLGMGGKETVLIKHLKSLLLDADHLVCDLLPPGEAAPVPEMPRWTVRQLLPEEAPEIARLVYKSYGYTYPHDYVYYPERIVALNEAGRVHSAIAIADEEEIAGHSTLQFLEDNPRIAELGQAVVKPEYRSRGCLRAMTEYLLRVAEGMGLHGIFTRPVTEHPFSQRSAYRFGLKDCGILLGMVPRHTPFKGLSEPLPYRGSLLLQFRYLKPEPGSICFAPPHHREMIEKIYANLGIAVEIRTDPGSVAQGNGMAVLKTQAAGTMQFARMIIERAARDAVKQVKTELQELCANGFEIIHLYLNLGDPETIRLTRELEEIGFLFAGILPEAFLNGHGLILQYLNDPPISYDSIVVETPMARDLIAYIRAMDARQPTHSGHTHGTRKIETP